MQKHLSLFPNIIKPFLSFSFLHNILYNRAWMYVFKDVSTNVNNFIKFSFPLFEHSVKLIIFLFPIFTETVASSLSVRWWVIELRSITEIPALKHICLLAANCWGILHNELWLKALVSHCFTSLLLWIS